MRTSLRLVLAVTLLASSSSASAVRDAAAPPSNLDNNDSPAPTPYSPFLPGLILDNIPFLNHHNHHAAVATAAAAPPPPLSAPTPASASSSDAAAAAASSPTTTPAPFYDNLFKRQASSSSRSSGGTTCPASYSACAALGAPGLCCHRSSNCAVDQAGHVACCPSGAVCTGSIRASSTVAPGYGVTTITEGAAGSSSLGSFVLPSTASAGTGTGGGFIIVASTTVAQPNAAGAGRRGLIPVVGWWFM